MPDTPPSVGRVITSRWALESPPGGDRRLSRVPIARLPFRIGRRAGLELSLPYESVSKEHAEIYFAGHGLHVRDLQSTNGTFSNQVRVQDTAIHEGDVLRFADCEMRVVSVAPPQVVAKSGDPDDTAELGERIPSTSDTPGGRELVELLE